MTKKKILRVLLVAAALLAIPLVMTNVSEEWDWNLVDFIVMGALIVGAGVAYELIASRLRTNVAKLTALLLTGIALAYVWAELAVGIFF